MKTKFVISLCLLIIQLCGYTQTEKNYKISGTVTDRRYKTQLQFCNVQLVSNKGLVIETRTDKQGYYNFDSLVLDNTTIIIKATKKGYFNNNDSREIKFPSVANDTIIDLCLDRIPIIRDFVFDFYFSYNSIIPDSNFQKHLSNVIEMLDYKKDVSVMIIAFKDSAETLDLRKERATLVYNEFIKRGIKKKRLKIEVSNKTNVYTRGEYTLDDKTNEYIFPEITETYIQNAPKEEQEVLRQRNRSVLLKYFKTEKE